jgi:arginyl-tRNA synthetase
MTVQQELQNKIGKALAEVLGDADISSLAPETLRVVPTANPQFGDYQFNGALPLAKVLKQNPRALAQSLVEKLDIENISEAPEIAGPGFINFRLKPEYLNRRLESVANDERLGVPQVENPRTVVVDFSSPNVAKPMHVGHIRSTIIGDSIARLLRFAGHRVVTDNHIGDWGTQFGKMIIGWKKHRGEENLQRDPIGEMVRMYQLVNAQSESVENVANEARRETTKLQAGDEENYAIWQKLRALSQDQFDSIYARLGVSFDETLGESFYNDQLQNVVEDLKQKSIAHESDGAVIVTFDESSTPALQGKVLVVQKSDGSSLYGTTDLATIEFRAEKWQPDEIDYVVDMRQSLHFLQVFETAKRWGYDDIKFVHVAFGTILGEDGRPIKTRSGEPIKLVDLLDEAEARALEIAKEKNPDASPETQKEIARVLGIGATKYADLSQNRTSDYQFSWEKMLALQGNSAVYLEYAYVRTRSILRRAHVEPQRRVDAEIILKEAAEIELAKFLLRFPLAIETALSDYRLNAISDYLFELSQKFTSFYDACPVIKSESPLRESRLALVELTGDVLRQGLNLLGIETIEQM